MAGQHALFSPSKAAVWFNCAGALALVKSAFRPPERPNIHGASGTFTHSLAERALNGQPLPPIGTRETHDEFEFTLDAERLERVEVYANAIRARGGLQFYEARLPIEPVIGVPEQFGTSDAVIVHVDTGTIEVHDLKDGQGIVSAEENLQMILYGLAAAEEYSYLASFKHLHVEIHQPRANWHSADDFTLEEMTEWRVRFYDAARAAQRVLAPTINAYQIRDALTPGAHCEKGWCEARGWCPARADAMKAQFPDPKLVLELSDADLGAMLLREAAIKSAFDAWRAEALLRAKAGGSIPGWILATGRAGPRKWRDGAAEDAAADAMFLAIGDETYNKSIITPTEAQKRLKKHGDVWEALQDKIVRSEGQPTLVPEASGRAPITLDAPEFGSVDAALDLVGGAA